MLELSSPLVLTAGRYWLGVQATTEAGSQRALRMHEPPTASESQVTTDGGATWQGITAGAVGFPAQDMGFAILTPARHAPPLITSVTLSVCSPARPPTWRARHATRRLRAVPVDSLLSSRTT